MPTEIARAMYSFVLVPRTENSIECYCITVSVTAMIITSAKGIMFSLALIISQSVFCLLA